MVSQQEIGTVVLKDFYFIHLFLLTKLLVDDSFLNFKWRERETTLFSAFSKKKR